MGFKEAEYMLQFENELDNSAVIKVIGVGGAGCNALKTINSALLV